jgi:outer membrane protein assembly factor BamB
LDKGLLQDWPTEGPKTLWRIPAGEGYSGMAVANGKLFTMWNEEKSQFLFCFEASSGKELWRYRIGEYFLNQYGNGPRSTPVVDGTTVYAVSARGRLDAVDLTNGQPRWSHDLAAEYGGQIPSIGYSSSPVVDDEKLIVEVGGNDGFAFAAFNKYTGELLWHSQTDLPAYSSPIVATINGTRQVVFLSAEGLFAVSPENGSLHWQYSWKTLCPATGIPLNAATPIFIAPDKIFISSGYGTISGATVVQLREVKKQFVAETLWNNQDMKNLVNSSVFFENHIYGFDDGIFKCLDAITGKEKWKARGFERGSLIVAGGHLIVLGERGKLALVEATPEAFKEVASVEILRGKCWTSPTLANGKLYLRNQKEMVCLDLAAK